MSNKLTADPAHDVTGNGGDCHTTSLDSLRCEAMRFVLTTKTTSTREVGSTESNEGINGDAVATVTSTSQALR